MSQIRKLMPNLDHQSTKVLNLTVLQRSDPNVKEILITASHVTLYVFNIELNQWSRKDVEGSLFVVKRNSKPRFQFIVMNRRNTDNLVEDLLGYFEYEVQVPYLFYRNAAQEINGVWFFNSYECEKVANLFSRILNAFSKVLPKAKVPSNQSCEFEELVAIPSLDVMEGPLEPPEPSTSSVLDAPDDSFVKFFTASTSNGIALNASPSSRHQPSATMSLSSQPIPPPPTLSTPLMLLHDTPESSRTSISNRVANLVKPSFFIPPSFSSALMMPPIASSVPTASPLQRPDTLQHPHGTPLLQPFPPPTPPLSLTPPNYGPVITRDKVHNALLWLVQKDSFIDIVYGEMLSSQYS